MNVFCSSTKSKSNNCFSQWKSRGAADPDIFFYCSFCEDLISEPNMERLLSYSYAKEIEQGLKKKGWKNTSNTVVVIT